MNLLTQWLSRLADYFTPEFFMGALLALFWLLMFGLFRRFLAGRILRLLDRLAEKSGLSWIQDLLDCMARPLQNFILLTGFYVFARTFPLTAPSALFWLRVYRSLAILLVASGLAAFAGAQTGKHIFRSGNPEVEATLAPMVTRGIKALVYLLALLIVAEEWNYDIKGFIAGLGLAGLAIAMGAQETIKNFLAGVFILTDKTFKVGDWIYTSTVEGTVEELSFRTTKIRTFAQAVITVPNSILANEPLTNWSRMNTRRLRFHLGVSYSTSQSRMRRVVERIRGELAKHPHVDPESLQVRFVEFGDSSLNILVQAFTDTLDYASFVEVQEEINYRIMSILSEENVEVAFPSTSVYLEKMPFAAEESEQS